VFGFSVAAVATTHGLTVNAALPPKFLRMNEFALLYHRQTVTASGNFFFRPPVRGYSSDMSKGRICTSVFWYGESPDGINPCCSAGCELRGPHGDHQAHIDGQLVRWIGLGEDYLAGAYYDEVKPAVIGLLPLYASVAKLIAENAPSTTYEFIPGRTDTLFRVFTHPKASWSTGVLESIYQALLAHPNDTEAFSAIVSPIVIAWEPTWRELLALKLYPIRFHYSGKLGAPTLEDL
jgi:hypothetical protein